MIVFLMNEELFFVILIPIILVCIVFVAATVWIALTKPGMWRL